ncbi:beta-eliminating lyase-related protein [Micromonospora sp. NPDC047548]|uniref:beta-eliminating lyase-related protein n=1 Tax=Micromonospora sp. NPDC047548 TaxID=3155624 RepID=UPI0033D97058
MPDFYGEGGAVEAVERRVADLLGTEAAVFFPSGTMAQQVAMRYGAELTGRNAVGLHPLSHPLLHERDAYAVLGGLRAVLTTPAPRNPTGEEVAALDEPIGTLLLELPLPDAGFVLPTWDELVAVVGTARDRGARVHLDGARLWESTVHLHTHQFRLWLPHPAGALNDANLALAEEEKAWFVGGWQDTEVPGLAMAEVTVAGPALEFDAAQVVELGERFLRRTAATA